MPGAFPSRRASMTAFRSSGAAVRWRLIGLSTAVPTRPGHASGEVGRVQLDRLARSLEQAGDPRPLPGGAAASPAGDRRSADAQAADRRRRLPRRHRRVRRRADPARPRAPLPLRRAARAERHRCRCSGCRRPRCCRGRAAPPRSTTCTASSGVTTAGCWKRASTPTRTPPARFVAGDTMTFELHRAAPPRRIRHGFASRRVRQPPPIRAKHLGRIGRERSRLSHDQVSACRDVRVVVPEPPEALRALFPPGAATRRFEPLPSGTRGTDGCGLSISISSARR